MIRIYIEDLKNHIGKTVTIAGWVDVRRDHGKLVFIDLRDRTGVVQTVIRPQETEAYENSKELRGEWVVEMTGIVNKRPENMVNEETSTGDIEVVVENILVLNKAAELPFDRDEKLNLDTYLDHLPLTLRTKRARDIFTIQATLVQSFREYMLEQNFIEYQNPILVGSDGEGGASAFKVEYYKDKEALLATSPQLYKQIMVGVFERVFTTTKVFRAEKHATSRHLSEVMQLDFEMGFIKNHEEVMDTLEGVMRYLSAIVKKTHADILERFNTDAPLVPSSIPRLTLREAQKILEEEFNIKCVGEPDLEPSHERSICEWAKEKHSSDFVFITHFPTNKRPFYTYIDEKDPEFTKSFDLLFRGLEINSGSQRVHDYDELIKRIKEKGLNPEIFSFYLEAFKYGIPPHGGCSTGLERLTTKFLELNNIKEATLFPRDMNRIDTLLSS